MRTIDFSKPGGFPLTQDQLNYLQTAYRESILALARVGGTDGPFIISGMEVSYPMPGEYEVTEGWLYYNGDMVHIPHYGISGVPAGHSVFINVGADNSTLTFNDGSTPEVMLNNYAALAALPSATPEDSTRFKLSSLKRFGVGFGLANRESTWNTLDVNTDPAVGGVTGTVYYKKNFINNTLHIRGLLSANNAQNFAASPASSYSLMGVLPVDYRPLNTVYFSSYYYVASSIKDDLNVSWIKRVNCGINNSGQFFINWIKPETTIGAYGLQFNTYVPLD